jgi:hypothetical protein
LSRALFLGVDPGATGAVALYCPATAHLDVFDVPFIEVSVSGKKRKRVDIPSLIAALGDIGEDRIVAGCLEQVASRPTDSHVTAFAFGEAFGSIKGCLAAALVPYELVTPGVWKKTFGLAGKKGASGADDARAIVSRLLPEHSAFFRFKKDHNRADAALLAVYCARTYKH